MVLTPLQLKSDVEKVLGVTRNPTTKKVLTFGLVGKYTYPTNNFVDAAINIGDPPNNIKVEGLEVIIDFPNTEASANTDRYVQVTEKFTIRLLQRSGENLFRARELFKSLGLTDYRDTYIPNSEVLGNYPQCVITFRYSDGF